MKILLLLIIGLLMILKVATKFFPTKDKKEKTKPINKGEIREELLLRLKKINRYDPSGYEDKTKEKIEELKKPIFELMEELMDPSCLEKIQELELSVPTLEKEEEIFTQELKKSIARWEHLEKEMNKDVEVMSEFFANYTFFPHEFVHDTNRLQRKLEDLREKRRVDPISSSEEIEKFANEFRERVEHFKELHKKTSDVFDKIPKDHQKAIELKEQLSILLQQGNTIKAEKVLRELKKYKK